MVIRVGTIGKTIRKFAASPLFASRSELYQIEHRQPPTYILADHVVVRNFDAPRFYVEIGPIPVLRCI